MTKDKLLQSIKDELFCKLNYIDAQKAYNVVNRHLNGLKAFKPCKDNDGHDYIVPEDEYSDFDKWIQLDPWDSEFDEKYEHFWSMTNRVNKLYLWD